MGNPMRYIFEDTFIGKPEINEDDKKLTVNFYNFRGSCKFEETYNQSSIDLYSAPDVIMTYTNGNTSKDEFRRLSRWSFEGLKLVNSEICGDYTKYVFTYENMNHKWLNWDDPESETNIPLGKLAGKTYEEVQQYKKQNTYALSWKKTT